MQRRRRRPQAVPRDEKPVDVGVVGEQRGGRLADSEPGEAGAVAAEPVVDVGVLAPERRRGGLGRGGRLLHAAAFARFPARDIGAVALVMRGVLFAFICAVIPFGQVMAVFPASLSEEACKPSMSSIPQFSVRRNLTEASVCESFFS